MVTLLAAALFSINTPPPEITIYNQGFGLVKETRILDLKAGRQSVAIEDVAARIEPESVGFRCLGDTGAFKILEQNYQYDLISTQAILAKSVGQKIRYIRSFANQREVLEGTLLSSPTAIVADPGGGQQRTYNGMVVRTDDNRILLNPTGEVEVQSIPDGLISKPTLMWDIDAVKSGPSTVELSYLTQGLIWSADYVLTLDGLGKGDIQGWVTLNNSSGATWPAAKLKLMAGDVNRVVQQPRVQFAANATLLDSGVVNKPFQEESLFEYHLYTLQRPAAVRNNETKQLSLLEGHDIPIKKKLIVDSMDGMGGYYPGEGEIGTGNIKPQVRLEFVNDEKSGLGMPLPKGKVKVYQRDASGSVQLLGEDQIDHTPRDEKLSLVVGRSFDVVSTRKRTNFTRIDSRAVSESFEIEVRNRHDTAETVYVLERHFGDWKIGSKSQPFEKLDANTAQFVVDLKPNEVKKVTYAVTTTW